MIQFAPMSNIDVPGLDFIQYPDVPVLVAHPIDAYQQILAPQTDFDGDRAYLPGYITTGGAINLPQFEKDIAGVIRENTIFAIAFWKTLLTSEIPFPVATLPDLRQAQLLLPHVIGKSAHPSESGAKEKSYGQHDFYLLELGWLLGVHPEMIQDFSTAMLANVALDILNDNHARRQERQRETLKIVYNTSNFFAKQRRYLNPVKAMVSLPDPDSKTTQSLGTEMEQNIAHNLAIPTYQAVIHPEVAKTDEALSPLWETIVGQWMLEELLKLTPAANPLQQSVSLQQKLPQLVA